MTEQRSGVFTGFLISRDSAYLRPVNSALSFANINKLAIPALIAGIAEPVLSITDTAIVGQYPRKRS